MDLDSMCEKYYRDVYRFAFSLSGDRGEAEDVAQETFAKAIASIGSFDGSRDILAWLFTIARNTHISRQRRERRAERQELCDEIEDEASVAFAKSLEDEETAFLVHGFLHGMDEPYKEVFHLRVFGELDFAKIGSLFGKSDNWARVTYYRAKSKISEYMEALNEGQL